MYEKGAFLDATHDHCGVRNSFSGENSQDNYEDYREPHFATGAANARLMLLMSASAAALGVSSPPPSPAKKNNVGLRRGSRRILMSASAAALGIPSPPPSPAKKKKRGKKRKSNN
jgi:hypothetical protein